MRYLVCKKQTGYGCDYTIGCGYIFEWIEAGSVEAAIEKTIWPDGRYRYSTLEGEYALETILIIPEDDVVNVDVGTMKKVAEEIRQHKELQLQRDSELAELKRLQEKYGLPSSLMTTSPAT